MTRLISARAALLLVSLLACTGCVPDVAWLPDSSGIIYSATDWPGMDPKAPAVNTGRLYLYDLAKGASRLIADTDTRTIQPALSPDGKRIAVARLNMTASPDPMLQVVVYDLVGKELQKTKAVKWGFSPRGEYSMEKFSQLFWAKTGNQVLIFANRHTGIWDLDADRVTSIGSAMPMIVGGSPQRPDGAGCLVVREDQSLAFVNWDGKPTAINLPADQIAGVHSSILHEMGVNCWTRWEGNDAILTWKHGQLRINTAKHTASYRNPDEAEWAWDGKEIQNVYTFPDGKTKVIVVFLKSYRDFRDAGLATVRVDFVSPEAGKSRTLIPETFHCGLYPSPDKKLVALRYVSMPDRTAADQYKDAIMVLDQAGNARAAMERNK